MVHRLRQKSIIFPQIEILLAHHDLAHDFIIGTYYKIPKLEPTGTKRQTPMLAQDLLYCIKSLKFPGPDIFFNRACHCIYILQILN